MSLLVLSAADVEKATASMSPDKLQILMASVFRTLSRGDRWLSSTPHRTSISMPQHTALFMPARIATDALTGTTVKVVSVPSSPGDTRGLPGSTLVLDEDTGAVKAIVNSRSLTALRNAAGMYLFLIFFLWRGLNILLKPRRISLVIAYRGYEQTYRDYYVWIWKANRGASKGLPACLPIGHSLQYRQQER